MKAQRSRVKGPTLNLIINSNAVSNQSRLTLLRPSIPGLLCSRLDQIRSRELKILKNTVPLLVSTLNNMLTQECLQLHKYRISKYKKTLHVILKAIKLNSLLYSWIYRTKRQSRNADARWHQSLTFHPRSQFLKGVALITLLIITLLLPDVGRDSHLALQLLNTGIV